MLKPPIALFLLALLLLVIIGQNLSPVLSIAFLGTKSISLPLGVWVALAIAAGVITSQVIGLMLTLVSPPRLKKIPKSRSRTAPPPIEPDSQEPWDEDMPASPPYEASVRRQPLAEETDNSQYRQADDPNSQTRQWRSDEEEWDNEQEWPTDSNANESRRNYDVNAPTFEMRQEPTESYRTGSVYGYSYRKEAETQPQDPLDRLEEVEAIPEPDLPSEDTNVYEDQVKRGDRKPSQNRSTQNSRDDDWDSRRNLDDEDWE
jgi:uncharacterized integral membrane protein